MPIIRCKDQKRQTLEEFYSEWASDKNQLSADLGKSMLAIIDLINNTFIETEIYGLTSHAHLLLLSQDSSDSDRLVSIIANGLQEFHVEYLIPKEKQPWSNATVKGATKSLDEFRNYIIIAMTESRGWKDNDELKRLYAYIKKV